jgi:hypothetical protein
VSPNLKLFVVAGLLVALALGVLASPFASTAPDGLERVAADQGFDAAAADHALGQSPVADYEVRGVADERVATGAAGLAGVLLTFGLGVGVFAGVRALRPSRPLPAGGVERAGTSPTT